MDPERGSVSSGAVVALCRTVAGRVPACKCRAERVQLRGRLVPLQGYQVRSGEVQRSSAEPGLSGATRGFPVPWTPAIPHRAVTRSCARCSPLYWLLPAKTQLPPYGGLREFELKCLRSHPTPLRFHPQALSGTPVLSYPFSCSFRFFPKKSKTLFNLIELYISRDAQYPFSYCHHFA